MDKKDFDEEIMDSDISKQKNFVSKNLIKGFQQKNGKLIYEHPLDHTAQNLNFVNNRYFNNRKVL